MKTRPNVASRETTSPAGTPAGRSLLARYGMLACCLVMLLPVGGYLLGGGTLTGLLDYLVLVVPLLACVGMHFVLHRVTGRSCHGDHEDGKALARRSGTGNG
ncbi:MAG: DUF2933 domain-containing protein [bacterium]|nr:DUF2933 domain-containing protein [bacterium]